MQSTRWLIEKRCPEGPKWATFNEAGVVWVSDADAACGFCRRQDAEQMAYGEEVDSVTEHIFDEPPRTAGKIMTIKSLDEAIGKVVRCTDGDIRILESYDDRLGYYAVPISEGVWMSLGGTYLEPCLRMFVGGTVDDPSPQISRRI